MLHQQYRAGLSVRGRRRGRLPQGEGERARSPGADRLVHRGCASVSEGAHMRQTARTSKLIATVTAIALATPLAAQDWPPRTTTIVLGLGPGSGLDLFARVIVDALQNKLGENFVVDYRVGAAGNIEVGGGARDAAEGLVEGRCDVGT